MTEQNISLLLKFNLHRSSSQNIQGLKQRTQFSIVSMTTLYQHHLKSSPCRNDLSLLHFCFNFDIFYVKVLTVVAAGALHVVIVKLFLLDLKRAAK